MSEYDLPVLQPAEASRPRGLPTLTSGMLRRIAGFIDTHIETPLRVERLAREAGMSRSYFSRAFRNALQMPPHRYVMWRRLQRAQDLITSSDVSLTEAALAVGFADQSHFCRLFRQNIGESPGRFRQRHRWIRPVGIDRGRPDRPVG